LRKKKRDANEDDESGEGGSENELSDEERVVER
jgi:hypothetical protein